MKTVRFFQLFFSIIICSLFYSQIYAKSISLVIEQPSSFFGKKDVLVTQLKISGVINKKTIATINHLYPNIEKLDMRAVKIMAYTDENRVVYLANEIPTSAFIKKQKLKTVILPHGVIRIGKGAFWNCPNLESVILSNSVQVIDKFAFQLCHKLSNITFPESLESIGGASFAGCELLSTIYCRSKIPPLMPDWNPFPDVKSDACVIYVPEKSIEKYKKIPFLKNFQILAIR